MFTIQQAAIVLSEHDYEFEPMQPTLVDGKFVARYRVNGIAISANGVRKLVDCLSDTPLPLTMN